MSKTKLFRQAFFILVVVGVLNWIGDTLYLFDSLWWYDILLHFLSGVCIALFAIMFWRKYSGAHSHRSQAILVAVLCALLLGIVWELYELYFGITSLSDGLIYATDTVKDLMVDSLGGFLGALYARRILNTL